MPVSKLPNFLCVGFEKCGTTSLYDLLKQHPDIGLSSNKETHFFSTGWDKGLPWYWEKFSHLPDSCQVIGEITPSYHRFPEVIPRIQEVLGKNVKIIFMLREPCRRAYSHYQHDFSNHLEQENYIFKTYLKPTPYAPAIKNYQEAFGRHNCLTLIFEEDFLTNQQKAVNMICEFLQIPNHSIAPVHSNPSFLPRYCVSPNYPCKLVLESKILEVPPQSFVVYTHRAKNTRIYSNISSTERQRIMSIIDNGRQEVSSLKRAVIFEQTAARDVALVEQLIQRKLDVWKDDKTDLQAEIAPPPEFIAI